MPDTPLPPSPPRAGASGEIPTNERIAALRSEVLKYEESAARYGTSHSLPFVLDALCGSQHAATRTALLAELAASAGEEIAALVERYRDLIVAETGESNLTQANEYLVDLKSVEQRILAHVAALAAQRDEALSKAMRAATAAGNERLRANRLETALSTSRAAALEAAAVYVETKADLGAHTANVIARAIRALGPGDASARGE